MKSRSWRQEQTGGLNTKAPRHEVHEGALGLIRSFRRAAGEELTREELFFRFWLFLFGHASCGAAGSGGAAFVEAPGLARQKREAGGDEQDHQKMLSPEWHVTSHQARADLED